MAVCARRADGVRRLFRRAGERPVAPGAGAAAVCTGSVRGAKEKPAHGVDGQAGHVWFFFAVLTEAIKIFFSSMHLLSISVSLLYPLSMSNSIQYSVSEHSFRAI